MRSIEIFGSQIARQYAGAGSKPAVNTQQTNEHVTKSIPSLYFVDMTLRAWDIQNAQLRKLTDTWPAETWAGKSPAGTPEAICSVI